VGFSTSKEEAEVPEYSETINEVHIKFGSAIVLFLEVDSKYFKGCVSFVSFS
jgi:hypothetical protein